MTSGIMVQGDHKIVVGGAVSGLTLTGFVARLNSGGTTDNGFGSNGISEITAPNGYSDTFVESLAIQSNGDIVASGSATKFDANSTTNLDPDVMIARLLGADVVTPANTAPVSSNGSGSVNEDGSVTIDLKTLTHDNETASAVLTYSIVATTSHGLLVNNRDGTVTYTPAGNYNGGDSFTFKAYDGQVDGNTATVNLNVNPVNDAPVTSGESYVTSEDTALSKDAAHGVLANDSDVDGDTLTAAVYAQTAHGALVLNADGSFSYTPGGNYNGSDSFQYTVSDGTVTSGPITVNITVNAVNDGPFASSDSYDVAGGTPLNVAAPGVVGNDTDVDGDALSASLFSGVSHGVLALNANGSFTYTPAAGFSGVDSFIYTASDGHGGTSNATVTLNVAPPVSTNQSPTANAGPDQTANEDLAVLFNGTGSSDPDSDVLTYSWNFGDGSPLATSGTPTHVYANSGTYTVVLTVNDGHSHTATDTMVVKVLSPQEAVQSIIDEANALHASGALNSGNTNALITKLDGAVAKLNKDDYNAAINKVQSFINQVSGWISNGKLSSSVGQPLIDSANDVIASITAEMNAA
jgi:VCBS repeat-containing protein